VAAPWWRRWAEVQGQGGSSPVETAGEGGGGGARQWRALAAAQGGDDGSRAVEMVVAALAKNGMSYERENGKGMEGKQKESGGF
jgi:hypothetical protein